MSRVLCLVGGRFEPCHCVTGVLLGLGGVISVLHGILGRLLLLGKPCHVGVDVGRDRAFGHVLVDRAPVLQAHQLDESTAIRGLLNAIYVELVAGEHGLFVCSQGIPPLTGRIQHFEGDLGRAPVGDDLDLVLLNTEIAEQAHHFLILGVLGAHGLQCGRRLLGIYTFHGHGLDGNPTLTSLVHGLTDTGSLEADIGNDLSNGVGYFGRATGPGDLQHLIDPDPGGLHMDGIPE